MFGFGKKTTISREVGIKMLKSMQTTMQRQIELNIRHAGAMETLEYLISNGSTSMDEVVDIWSKADRKYRREAEIKFEDSDFEILGRLHVQSHFESFLEDEDD